MAFTFGPRLPSFPINGIEFLWDAAEVQLVSGNVDVWPDQIGNLDWTTFSGGSAERFGYAPNIPEINNQPVITNTASSRMIHSGITGTFPFVLYYVSRYYYNTNFGYRWRDGVDVAAQPRWFGRPGGDQGEMWAGSLNLPINGTNGINWNTSTNALLQVGEVTPFHLMKFLWTDSGYSLSRDGVTVKSGNSPTNIVDFVGDFVYYSTSGQENCALHFGGFFEPTVKDDVAIAKYVNDRFGLNVNLIRS